MDAVRFGRALGFGARQAAKTVVRAVDAARAENPSRPPAANVSHAASAASATRPAVPATPRSAPATLSNSASARGVREGFSRFHASAVEPAVRLSGVLWLEVMGVFFGIFALTAGSALWRLRGELRAALAHPAAHGSLIGAGVVFTLFAYFSISSFVRARRRQLRRG